PRQPPWRFEAGTPAMEAVAGVGAAVEYLEEGGLDRVARHTRAFAGRARGGPRGIPGGRLGGAPGAGEGKHRPGRFAGADTPSHMIARTLSDGYGICVRSGHHCAQPLHEHLKVPATVRVSFYLYTQPGEIELFLLALTKTLGWRGRARPR